MRLKREKRKKLKSAKENIIVFPPSVFKAFYRGVEMLTISVPRDRSENFNRYSPATREMTANKMLYLIKAPIL
jgi:hypothetical protein